MNPYLVLIGILAAIVLIGLLIDSIIVKCPMCGNLYISIGYFRPVYACRNCR